MTEPPTPEAEAADHADQPRAWLLLSVASDRQHGGNDGYDDDPSDYYSWDSTVPNHAALQQGDRIALWDKHVLLGASVIESVERGISTKKVHRCARCKGPKLKSRKKLRPRYRCPDCGAEFDEPVTLEVEVTTYRCRHDAGWADLTGILSAAELRALCVQPKSQHSLRPLRWNAFRDALRSRGFDGELTMVDSAARMIATDGHTDRMVRVRNGQPAFRSHLLATFGSRCAFTGELPEPALEAAHLYSYAQTGRHEGHGGVLLRRDLHRLFDLGLLAVRPDNLTIDVGPSLLTFSEYSRLNGQPLQVTLDPAAVGWVRRHWRTHREHDIPDAGTGGSEAPPAKDELTPPPPAARPVFIRVDD